MAWYRRSATAGNTHARAIVGSLYLAGGYGVTQDYRRAMLWYEMAASENDATGMSGLAVLYENGLGVQKDINQARTWYEKAAAAGDADAKKWLTDHPAN